MRNGKTCLTLCAVLALALGSFWVPSALAQKAFECASTSGGGAGFSDAHCKNSTSSGATFKHVEITGTKLFTATNVTTGAERSVFKLKSVQSGVTLELQATMVEGNGRLENFGTFAEGFGFLTLSGVTVTAPAGKGCLVVGVPVTFLEKAAVGVVHTRELRFRNSGLTNQLQFLPGLAGEPLAEFEVASCSVKALNHLYQLTGSVTGNTSGATINFTHANATEQNTLFLSGQKAGIEGSLTLKGESTGNGIAFT